jgi:5'-methylthioadenosine/S-adenosylhomocysteine nucleosidase
MIAIIGAMEEEIQEFLRHTENIQKSKWKHFTFYRGQLEQKEVVIVKTGLGKILASVLTQKLIELFKPEKILFTGIAGGILPEINIGDVVVAKNCIQHDMDVTALGFKRGEIPFSPWQYIETSESLQKIALSFSSSEFKIFHGTILTGDQFMTHQEVHEKKFLRSEMNGYAVEMEGAAVALVALINEIPCLILRTISDRADGNAHVDFNKFMPIASKRNFDIIKFILKNC